METDSSGFTTAGVRRGMRAAAPIMLGLVPFGLVVGVISAGKGLSFLETTLMSALVYAGTSQILALELWQSPAPVLAATLAAFVINLRMAPMGAALAPVLDHVRGLKLWGTLAFLVDNAFGLTVVDMRQGRRDAGFLFGAAFIIWVLWVTTCAAGHLLGAAVRLPPGHAIFFAALGSLLALLVPIWRGRSDLLPWCVAGLVSLAAYGLGLPAPWPVLVGAFSGAALGAWRDTRQGGGAAAR